MLTSLDRDVRREFSTKYPNGIVVTGFYHDDRDEEGRKHLRKFQEEASRLAAKIPAEADSGSWFALMQHYGTPTRFLDWTSSPYVAAYFAFEKEAQEDEKRSAIWAIDLDWLEKRGQELLQAKGWILTGDNPEDRARWENRLLTECQEAVIIKMNPLQPNDRMAAQEGILLCKLFHVAFFSQTLMRMMMYPEVVQQPVVRKLEIDTQHRAEFLDKLRAMNIHRASLFPDEFHVVVA